MHSILAGVASVPELELTKQESDTLAKGINNVARHYNTIISQKQLDWMNLAMVVGGIYGGRLLLINTRLRAERARDATPKAAPTGAGASQPKPQQHKPNGKTPPQAPTGVIDIPGVGSVNTEGYKPA